MHTIGGRPPSIPPQISHQSQPHPHQSQHKNHIRQELFHPDWDLAEKHKLASKVGFSSQSVNGGVCSCCLEQVDKEEIPLNQNTKELEFLGFGFPLYYAFVRNCIFLLIVCICSYNIIALYQAIVSNKDFCHGNHVAQAHHPHKKDHDFLTMRHFSEEHHTECTSWMVDLSRVQKTVTFTESLIRVASFAIHLILLIYIRDKLLKLKEYFDERTASPSDYSMMIEDIPPSNDPNRNIRALVTSKLNQEFQSGKIVDIILIPDLKDFEDMEHEQQGLVKKIREKIEKHDEAGAKQLEHKYELYENSIKSFIKNNKMLDQQNRMQAERAIIIMNTEDEKSDVLDKYEEQGFRSPGWQNVKLGEAPEPKQFIWENIALSTPKRVERLALGWCLSILVLVILTVIFAFISKAKSVKVEADMDEFKETHNQGYKTEAFIIVFLMIFFVVMFNKIVIANLFHYFTDLERHSTTHKFQFSFCLKYCLGLFFTTALMTLIVQAFILKNYYQHDFGVVEQQTIMYIVNSVFVPIFWIINPIYIYKSCVASRHKGQKYYTQQQANRMLEYPQYDVGKRYGEVLEIVWFTFLYMTLIPIGGVISAVGLVIYYWIDKYNLLRRSTIRSYVSGHLINLTLNLLDVSLVLRVVGEIIFDYHIRDGAKPLSWVCLAISLIYVFLPKDDLIELINNEKFNSEEMTYQEASSRFHSTYYNEHVLFSYLEEDRNKLAQNLVTKLVQSLIPGLA